MITWWLACSGTKDEPSPPPPTTPTHESGTPLPTVVTGPPDTAVDGVDQDHDGADGPVVPLGEVSTTILTSASAFEQLGYVVACSADPIADHPSAFAAVTTNQEGESRGAVYLFAGDVEGDRDPGSSAFFHVVGQPEDDLGKSGILLPGDLNGDGSGDLVAADPEDRAPDALTGSVWVFDPAAGSSATPSSAVAWFRGTNGAQHRLGRMSSAGDFDGDAVPDLWLGETDPAGEAPAVIRLYRGSDAHGTVDVDRAVVSVDWPNPESAVLMRLLGGSDLTGDGELDLIAADAQVGRVFIAGGPVEFLGRDALTGASVRIEDPEPTVGSLGFNMAVGDLNDDGQADIAVPAHVRDGPAGERQGAVFVWFGPLSGVETTDEADLTLRGEVEFQMFGISTAIADHDGDGHLDLVVAAPSDPFYGPPRAGLVYVFRGPLSSGTLEASSAARVYRGLQAFELLGKSLAACDLDGDGDAELVIGAPGDSGRNVEGGRVFVARGGSF